MIGDDNELAATRQQISCLRDLLARLARAQMSVAASLISSVQLPSPNIDFPCPW
jgi:hypothetical protein